MTSIALSSFPTWRLQLFYLFWALPVLLTAWVGSLPGVRTRRAPHLVIQPWEELCRSTSYVASLLIQEEPLSMEEGGWAAWGCSALGFL